ncbi:diguanylate cyclase, partial [bacterium]
SLEQLPYDKLKKWVITFSVGLALYHTGISGEELIESADTALYKAKENGRNRVSSSPVGADVTMIIKTKDVGREFFGLSIEYIARTKGKSVGYYEEVEKDIIGEGLILDLGCGAEHKLLDYLRARGADIIGVDRGIDTDLSKRLYRIDAEHLAGGLKAHDINDVKVVISTAFFNTECEQLYGLNRKAVLKQIYEVLPPSGKAYIVAAVSSKEDVQSLKGAFEEIGFEHETSNFVPPAFISVLTKASTSSPVRVYVITTLRVIAAIFVAILFFDLTDIVKLNIQKKAIANTFEIKDSVEINTEYLLKVVSKAGWQVLKLSKQEWENNKFLRGYEYSDGGAVVIPDDKTIFYAGNISSIGHLAHEITHVLQSLLTDDEIVTAYNGFLKALKGNKEATKILSGLMKVYTTKYNPELIKFSKSLPVSERNKYLKANAAHETFALIFGMLVGEKYNSKTLTTCSLDEYRVAELLNIIKNTPVAKAYLAQYYTKLGFDETKIVKGVFSASSSPAASSPLSRRYFLIELGLLGLVAFSGIGLPKILEAKEENFREIIEKVFIKEGGKVIFIKNEEWRAFTKAHGYHCPISGLAFPEEKTIYFPEGKVEDGVFAHEVVHILQRHVLRELLRNPDEFKAILKVMNKLGDDAFRKELKDQATAPIPYGMILTLTDQFFAYIYGDFVEGNKGLINKLGRLPEVKDFLVKYYSRLGLPLPRALVKIRIVSSSPAVSSPMGVRATTVLGIRNHVNALGGKISERVYVLGGIAQWQTINQKEGLQSLIVLQTAYHSSSGRILRPTIAMIIKVIIERILNTKPSLINTSPMRIAIALPLNISINAVPNAFLRELVKNLSSTSQNITPLLIFVNYYFGVNSPLVETKSFIVSSPVDVGAAVHVTNTSSPAASSPVGALVKVESNTESIAKAITALINSVSEKDGVKGKHREYRLVATNARLGNEWALEVYVYSKEDTLKDRILGSVRLTVLNMAKIVIENAEFYNPDDQGQGLFSYILKVISEITGKDVALELYKVEEAKTMIEANTLLPREYRDDRIAFILKTKKAEYKEFLYLNLVKAILDGAKINHKYLIESPVFRALKKTGYAAEFFVAEVEGKPVLNIRAVKSSSPIAEKDIFIQDLQIALARHFGVEEKEVSIPKEFVEYKYSSDTTESRVVSRVFVMKKPYFVKTARYGEQEVPGSNALKALLLPNPNTQFVLGFSYNYYLYEWIGNINLLEIPLEHLRHKNFRYSYACELGKAAAAAFIIGLADRSPTNHVASFAYGDTISAVINIDLTPSFAYLGREPKDSLEEQVALLKRAITVLNENSYGKYTNKFRDNFLECFGQQISETRRLLGFKRGEVSKALSDATGSWQKIITRIESANEQIDSLIQKISDETALSSSSVKNDLGAVVRMDSNQFSSYTCGVENGKSKVGAVARMVGMQTASSAIFTPLLKTKVELKHKRSFMTAFAVWTGRVMAISTALISIFSEIYLVMLVFKNFPPSHALILDIITWALLVPLATVPAAIFGFAAFYLSYRYLFPVNYWLDQLISDCKEALSKLQRLGVDNEDLLSIAVKELPSKWALDVLLLLRPKDISKILEDLLVRDELSDYDTDVAQTYIRLFSNSDEIPDNPILLRRLFIALSQETWHHYPPTNISLKEITEKILNLGEPGLNIVRAIINDINIRTVHVKAILAVARKIGSGAVPDLILKLQDEVNIEYRMAFLSTIAEIGTKEQLAVVANYLFNKLAKSVETILDKLKNGIIVRLYSYSEAFIEFQHKTERTAALLLSDDESVKDFINTIKELRT